MEVEGGGESARARRYATSALRITSYYFPALRSLGDPIILKMDRILFVLQNKFWLISNGDLFATEPAITTTE